MIHPTKNKGVIADLFRKFSPSVYQLHSFKNLMEKAGFFLEEYLSYSLDDENLTISMNSIQDCLSEGEYCHDHYQIMKSIKYDVVFNYRKYLPSSLKQSGILKNILTNLVLSGLYGTPVIFVSDKFEDFLLPKFLEIVSLYFCLFPHLFPFILFLEKDEVIPFGCANRRTVEYYFIYDITNKEIIQSDMIDGTDLSFLNSRRITSNLKTLFSTVHTISRLSSEYSSCHANTIQQSMKYYMKTKKLISPSIFRFLNKKNKQTCKWIEALGINPYLEPPSGYNKKIKKDTEAITNEILNDGHKQRVSFLYRYVFLPFEEYVRNKAFFDTARFETFKQLKHRSFFELLDMEDRFFD